MRLTCQLATEETAPKRTYLIATCHSLRKADSRSHSTVFDSTDILICCRETCAQLYRLHVGPQVVGCLLGGHESVCHDLDAVNGDGYVRDGD